MSYYIVTKKVFNYYYDELELAVLSKDDKGTVDFVQLFNRSFDNLTFSNMKDAFIFLTENVLKNKKYFYCGETGNIYINDDSESAHCIYLTGFNISR